MLGIATKSSHDTLDYDVDFARWLDDGDSIQSADAATASNTITTVESVSINGQVVKVWLSGGSDGETACIDVTVTTTNGRTKQVSFKLRIKECC